MEWDALLDAEASDLESSPEEIIDEAEPDAALAAAETGLTHAEAQEGYSPGMEMEVGGMLSADALGLLVAAEIRQGEDTSWSGESGSEKQTEWQMDGIELNTVELQEMAEIEAILERGVVKSPMKDGIMEEEMPKAQHSLEGSRLHQWMQTDETQGTPQMKWETGTIRQSWKTQSRCRREPWHVEPQYKHTQGEK